MLIDETLQEIHWFKEQFSSWFIGDYALEGMHVFAFIIHLTLHP